MELANDLENTVHSDGFISSLCVVMRAGWGATKVSIWIDRRLLDSARRSMLSANTLPEQCSVVTVNTRYSVVL